MNPVPETEPYILVEGPRWADAEFYGKWLLMATKAQALWEKAIKDNVPNQEACQALLLKMRDEGLVKFDIHKGQWLIA